MICCLKFIIGKDDKLGNLFHCLGSGQCFKYSPVFGELIAAAITGDGVFIAEINAVSISRFDDNYMKNFWDQVSGSENTLVAEAASL